MKCFFPPQLYRGRRCRWPDTRPLRQAVKVCAVGVGRFAMWSWRFQSTSAPAVTPTQPQPHPLPRPTLASILNPTPTDRVSMCTGFVGVRRWECLDCVANRLVPTADIIPAESGFLPAVALATAWRLNGPSVSILVALLNLTKQKKNKQLSWSYLGFR